MKNIKFNEINNVKIFPEALSNKKGNNNVTNL